MLKLVLISCLLFASYGVNGQFLYDDSLGLAFAPPPPPHPSIEFIQQPYDLVSTFSSQESPFQQGPSGFSVPLKANMNDNLFAQPPQFMMDSPPPPEFMMDIPPPPQYMMDMLPPPPQYMMDIPPPQFMMNIPPPQFMMETFMPPPPSLQLLSLAMNNQPNIDLFNQQIEREKVEMLKSEKAAIEKSNLENKLNQPPNNFMPFAPPIQSQFWPLPFTAPFGSNFLGSNFPGQNPFMQNVPSLNNFNRMIPQFNTFNQPPPTPFNFNAPSQKTESLTNQKSVDKNTDKSADPLQKILEMLKVDGKKISQEATQRQILPQQFQQQNRMPFEMNFNGRSSPQLPQLPSVAPQFKTRLPDFNMFHDELRNRQTSTNKRVEGVAEAKTDNLVKKDEITSNVEKVKEAEKTDIKSESQEAFTAKTTQTEKIDAKTESTEALAAKITETEKHNDKSEKVETLAAKQAETDKVEKTV